jgi:putative transcriptional regulator
MTLHAGSVLKSTATLQGTIFADTQIFIVEYNAEGALGFVINRPFGRSLNELVEFSHVPFFPLYNGGPVDTEHVYFIHNQSGIITGGTVVKDGVYYGGDFSKAVAGIKSKTLSTSDIKIFVGYCGWDKGELEAEIEEGSWEVESRFIDVFQ